MANRAGIKALVVVFFLVPYGSAPQSPLSEIQPHYNHIIITIQK